MSIALIPETQDSAPGTNRALPVNISAEKAFLGAVFVDVQVIESTGFLRPEHFALPIHGEIWAECVSMRAGGGTPNPVTLRNFMENHPDHDAVKGGHYLVDLAASAVLVINAVEYARIILDLHRFRQLLGISDELADSARRGNAGEALEALETGLAALDMDSGAKGGLRPVSEFASETVGAIK